MKNALTYLFVVFLAALVFYGGAGVNLVTYCCTDCSSEGVTALLESKCCDITTTITVHRRKERCLPAATPVMGIVAVWNVSVSIGVLFILLI